MYRSLPALMLCMALQPAWAGGPAAGSAHARPDGPRPELHASLAAPARAAATEAGGPAPVVVAALQDDAGATPPEPQPERHTSRDMLLAALALMAGIVLRRWGVGER